MKNSNCYFGFNFFFLSKNYTSKYSFLLFFLLFLGLNNSTAQNCVNTPDGTVTSTPVSGGCDLVVDLCILVDGSPRPKRIEYTINYDSNGDNIKDATQTFVFLPGGSGAPNGTHCLSTFAPSESFIVPGVACNTAFDATISGYTSAGGGGGNICHEFIGNLTEAGGFVENSLPVEMLSFEGKPSGNSNQLIWETAIEKNVNAFVVERMGEGETEFEELERVQAVGNSTIIQTYDWEDLDPLFFGYYRLRIVDFDGSFEYSSVQAVKREVEELEIKNVYPNPIMNKLNVDFTSLSSEVSIKIFNVQGKLSFQKYLEVETGNNSIQFHINDLSKGIYFLKLNDGINEVQQRIVKM